MKTPVAEIATALNKYRHRDKTDWEYHLAADGSLWYVNRPHKQDATTCTGFIPDWITDFEARAAVEKYERLEEST